MRTTPLYEEHLASGARMVDFHGWALPIQYTGILHEHRHTRTDVSLFDCSHMAEFRIRGEEAINRYDRLVISDISRLRVGRGRYGVLLNERGGIVDDIITIRLAEDELLVVSNAASVDAVSDKIARDNPGAENISPVTAKIDVQGPGSRDVLIEAGLRAVAALGYFDATRTTWRGIEIIVTRMGYTGELGFELYVPADIAVSVWRALSAAGGVAPAGLGARDTLRLEMGYPLSGQDFDETKTPLEASQAEFIAWDSEFPGKQELLRQRAAGDYIMLTGIRTQDRRAPRHGFDVYAAGAKVGVVTSGVFGPSVGYGIGLAYLPQEYVRPGTRLETGPKRLPVEVAALPFYKQGTCRR